MVHPQDWGKGPIQEIAEADLVISYMDDENPGEILKDRYHAWMPSMRIIVIDSEGNRHQYFAQVHE